MLLAESENNALADGRTLESNFLNGGYNITPHFLKWQGTKPYLQAHHKILQRETFYPAWCLFLSGTALTGDILSPEI